MAYRIQQIDLYVRQISPPRMDFAIGKGKSLFPEWMRANVEVRLMLESAEGQTAFGCAADWPSFGWLDKRPDVEPKAKLIELLELIELARQTMLANPELETVFDGWLHFQSTFLKTPQASNGVSLCCGFAIALMERALIDAFGRLTKQTFFEMLKNDQLGFDAIRIHPDVGELSGRKLSDQIPDQPLDSVQIRHTVGPTDPLNADELDENDRMGDGEPETLADYVREHGITSFKIKICGDPDKDLERLAKIWDVIKEVEPYVTLDGNEAYDDLTTFQDFVHRLGTERPDLLSHVALIEQPRNRDATCNDSESSATIRALSQIVPLIIDEADGHLTAYKEALALGYSGVSHKNCKGIFKSLGNFMLSKLKTDQTPAPFLSAEDLTVMPMVSLQQDLTVVAALGLANVERNGHHFFHGLDHLTATEKELALTQFGKLYEQRSEGVFMKIVDGRIDISQLQVSGLGVTAEPDYGSMGLLHDWIVDLQA